MSLRTDKPLPPIPQPSIVHTSSTSAQHEEQEEAISEEDMALPLADVHSRSATPDLTGREYALLELLQSERTYVRDLVLLRDYQIPLASGRLSSMSSIWPRVDATIHQYLGGGPAVSDLVTSLGAPRPSTTVSDVSAMSFGSIFTLRPMKTKDINIVFGNIDELAAFSEEFLHQLESALGELIEGNEGEDFVGSLFLDFLPEMEPLYETYVKNHPQALEHYHQLSKTFQFDIYFPRSQILAHKSSNAWDLPSLLIKPVQRLLHYPQLLAAILAQTPDTHRDKEALEDAHAWMMEMARGSNSNEPWRHRRRQQKVVREAVDPLVLHSGAGALQTRKKSELNVSLSGSLNLDHTVVPRLAPDETKNIALSDVDRVVEVIKAGGEQLKKYEKLLASFITEAINWADTMRTLVSRFEEWALVFLRIVWSGDIPVGRRDLFMPAWLVRPIGDMKSLVNNKMKMEVTVDLAGNVRSLRNLISTPISMVEEMQRLEPRYYQFLYLTSTNSPPPSLILEGSRSYVALRGQLSKELPTFLTLLDKGMAACVLKFARIQWRFYSNTRDLWRVFWDDINVEWETSETNANEGVAETLRIWARRFSEADEQLGRLNILRGPPLAEEPTDAREEDFSNPTASGHRGPGTTSSVASSSESSPILGPTLDCLTSSSESFSHSFFMGPFPNS